MPIWGNRAINGAGRGEDGGPVQTVDLLRQSYYSLKKEAAAGVDGMTWEEYGGDLEVRLSATYTAESIAGHITHNRHEESGSRKPTDGNDRRGRGAGRQNRPARGGDGPQPDREEEFLGISYGFRPGRGPHDALDALWVGIVRKKVNWIVDLDIRSFFDTPA